MVLVEPKSTQSTNDIICNAAKCTIRKRLHVKHFTSSGRILMYTFFTDTVYGYHRTLEYTLQVVLYLVAMLTAQQNGTMSTMYAGRLRSAKICKNVIVCRHCRAAQASQHNA